MTRAAVLLFFVGSIFFFFEPSFAGDAEPGYDIIVIGGQSNAVGAGRGAYRDSVRSIAIDRRIYQLGRNIENCVNDEGKVIPASDILEHWLNCPKWGGVGFGMAFARRWAASPLSQGRKVLIIPGAYGGTTMQQWRTSLWPALKSQIKEALAQPGGRNRVVAFLWSQGESDAAICADHPEFDLCHYDGSSSVREQWCERMVALFQDFHTLFDPKAEAAVLATGFVPAWKEVRSDKDPKNPCASSDGKALDDPNCYASLDVTANKQAFENELGRLESSRVLPRFAHVETAGLTSNGEVGASMQPAILPLFWTEAQIHFSAQGQIDLGDRLWQRFLTLQVR